MHWRVEEKLLSQKNMKRGNVIAGQLLNSNVQKTYTVLMSSHQLLKYSIAITFRNNRGHPKICDGVLTWMSCTTKHQRFFLLQRRNCLAAPVKNMLHASLYNIARKLKQFFFNSLAMHSTKHDRQPLLYMFRIFS